MIQVSKLTKPNGYWYVRYWVGGHAVDESTRTKSESAAEQYRLRRGLSAAGEFSVLVHEAAHEFLYSADHVSSKTRSRRLKLRLWHLLSAKRVAWIRTLRRATT